MKGLEMLFASLLLGIAQSYPSLQQRASRVGRLPGRTTLSFPRLDGCPPHIPALWMHDERGGVDALQLSSESQRQQRFGIPRRLKTMNVWMQTAVVLLYYTLHVVVFPHFEHRMHPLNDMLYDCLGIDFGIGLDDIIGVITLMLTFAYHKVNGLSLPRLFNVSHNKAPWGSVTLKPMPALSVVISICLLHQWTGGLQPQITMLTNQLAMVLPITPPIQQNLVVVILHTAWVALSVALLKSVDNFFPRKIVKGDVATAIEDGAEEAEAGANGEGGEKRVEAAYGGTNIWGTRSGKSAWWSSTRRANWVWWVIGGYAVTVLLSHLTEAANTLVLPKRFMGGHERNVVSRMNAFGDEGAGAGAGGESLSAPFSPGLGMGRGADALALGIGSVAPCISAPWWEELFYRGFVYPWLASFLPMILATPSSALLFAAHHAQADAMLPLASLGVIWALLYLLSGNLLVPMVVHAMWNSRIFLTSLLSLLYPLVQW